MENMRQVMKVRLTSKMLEKLLLSRDFKIEDISDYFNSAIFTVTMPYDNLSKEQVQKIEDIPLPITEYYINVEDKKNYKTILEFEKNIDLDVHPKLRVLLEKLNKE